MSVKVEICVSSIQEAIAASEIGVDSIELCTWLSCGGVTPSIGMVQRVREVVPCKVRVLVRPGPGAFSYSAEEQRYMLNDMKWITDSGGLDLVTGALDGHNTIDLSFMKEVRSLSQGKELTFHRAIDQMIDPLEACDICADLGVDRVLTSGGGSTALEGLERLARMVQHGEGRIRIAAAGSIGRNNVVEVVERTGVQEVHFAAQRPVDEVGNPVSLSSVGSTFDQRMELDKAKVEGVLNALTKAGLR